MRVRHATLAVAGLLAAAFLCGLSGCSTTTAPRPGAPTIALSIRTKGDRPPTAEQLDRAYRSAHEYLLAAGYRFAEVPAMAQFLVTADFFPSPVDPAGGHVRIVAVEPSHAVRKTLTSDDATEEAREMRQRLRDIENWIEQQAKTRPGEGAN